MRKLRAGIGCMAVLLALTGLLAGCGKSTEKTQEGKLENQLAMPSKGDEIAVLHVKDYGDITVRFFKNAAPKAVENFVKHAKEKYYDGVLFHRVISDFMIQSGDPTGVGNGGDSIWGGNFENECVDYLMPIRGSLCMANAGADTNKSQFFIVQMKNAITDSRYTVGLSQEQIDFISKNGGATHLMGMHTVFGQVIEGMDVVDKIAVVKTNNANRPLSDVVISSIEVKKY